MTVPQPYRIERHASLPDMPFPAIVTADENGIRYRYAVDQPWSGLIRWQAAVVAIEPEDVRYPATGDAPQAQPEPDRIKVGDKVLLKGTAAPEFVVAAIIGGPSNREDGIQWLRLIQVWPDGTVVMSGPHGGPSIVEDIDINAVELVKPRATHRTPGTKADYDFVEIVRGILLTDRTILRDMAEVVVYRSVGGDHDGKVWVRPVDEFDDPERFEDLREPDGI